MSINTDNSYTDYVLINPLPQSPAENKSGWGSTCATAAKSIAGYAASHIGGTMGTGYAAVHATEITGLITTQVCGAGIVNWWARYSLAAKLMPYIATGGGIVGGVAAGLGVAILCKGVEFAANKAMGSHGLPTREYSMIDLKKEQV